MFRICFAIIFSPSQQLKVHKTNSFKMWQINVNDMDNYAGEPEKYFIFH